MRARNRAGTAAAALLLLPQAAWAHRGHDAASGLAAGLAHPLTGADHVAAMVAVGLLAARQGGRATWLLPAMFVGAMTAAALVPLDAIDGATEMGIAGSLVALGLLLAMAAWPRPAVVAAIVAVGAAFHGHAHAVEAPAGARLGYVAGFVAATALLHAAGVALGRGLRREGPLVRAAGVAVAGFGAVLAFG